VRKISTSSCISPHTLDDHIPPFEYVNLAQLELKPTKCAVRTPSSIHSTFQGQLYGELDHHSSPASSGSVSTRSDRFRHPVSSPSSLTAIASERSFNSNLLSQSPAASSFSCCLDEPQDQNQQLRPGSVASIPDQVSPQSYNSHGTRSHVCPACGESFTHAHLLKYVSLTACAEDYSKWYL
jgi:hypothetical protein